jgi:hypothetical protein
VPIKLAKFKGDWIGKNEGFSLLNTKCLAQVASKGQLEGKIALPGIDRKPDRVLNFLDG